MSDWKQRTQLLIGEDGLQKLEQSHVLVVGLGGVGSYAAEALVRAGVGTMTIVDGDVVDPTNKNRQLQALDSTIGQHKALQLKERFLDINPHIQITAHCTLLDGGADVRVIFHTTPQRHNVSRIGFHNVAPLRRGVK